MSQKIIECKNLPLEIENSNEYLILQQNPNTFTHGYFKYPCKFIPEIPRWFLKKYIKKGEKILDPFAGSGTTLLEASINGIQSVGIEINKFSELLIKVKTTKLSSKEIEICENFFNNMDFKIDYAYPKINNLKHWFEEDNLIKLAIIKENINKIDNINAKNFLNICFASIIRKCSKADDVSPKPYVSKKIKKNKYDPYNEFNKIVKLYLERNKALQIIKYQNNLVKTIRGDSTHIELKQEFSGAITSPPYINAYDYVRILRLETLWLGLADEDELRKAKKHYTGTENISVKNFNDYDILNYSPLLKKYYEEIKYIDTKKAFVLLKFFNDMKKNLIMVNKALLKDKIYAVVIGNSKIRGVKIESWKVLSQIAAQCGFKQEYCFSYRIRNHYLRIDRQQKGGKITSDFVLILRKQHGT